MSTASAATDIPDRLYYGEILFESLRGHHFDALKKFQLYFPDNGDIKYNGSGTLSVIELQLAFGLSQSAEKNITVKPHNIQQRQLHNHDIYRLAKFYYKKQQPVAAIQTLEMVALDAATDTTKNNSDIQRLKALAYIQVGKFNNAVKILQNLTDKNTAEYTQYNLGIAQLQSGDTEKGLLTLEELGQVTTSNIVQLALKDKANLQLGQYYLRAGKARLANKYFNLVRIESPYTGQALLGSGWASFSLGQPERAVVPWTLLHENKTLNASVIEAKMALPYAYAKLGTHGKAANLYGHAIELFEKELIRLDAAMDDIGKGKLTQHILNNFTRQDKDWFTDLIHGTEREEKNDLILLFSTDQFQQAAETLHELALLKNHIEQAQTQVTAYKELISLKKKHYSVKIPEAEKELLKIHQQINRLLKLQHDLTGETNKQQNADVEIAQLKQDYENHLLIRKAVAKHLRQLPERRLQLTRIEKKLTPLNNKLISLISLSAKQLESVAIEVLKQKHRQLKSYHDSALFSLAESYELATREQQ